MWDPGSPSLSYVPMNDDEPTTIMKCVWCHKIKAATEFPLRNFQTGPKRTKTCIVCVPKKSANRKRWKNTTAGLKWQKDMAQKDTVQESTRRHKASELCRTTSLTYRTNPTVRAKQKEKEDFDPSLRFMRRIGSKMSSMSKGVRNRSCNVHALTGFAHTDELLQHLRSTCSFDLDHEDWHVDHIIAKAWYVYHFNGVEVSKVPVSAENMKRCWNHKNLEAKTALENLCKNYNLPPWEELLELKPIWPVHWNGIVPSSEFQKAMSLKINGGRGKA